MEKKKVGLITFHNADNLGAVLQAYALQEVLQHECGTEPQVIDYHCEIIERGRYALISMSLKGITKSIPMAIYYRIKRDGFERFRKRYLERSKPYSKETVSECVLDYDLFISGSDQVWNLECSDWDDSYFLDFVPDEKEKYSYAASIGNYRFKEEEQHRIKSMLHRFQRISVREQSAANHLQEMGLDDVAVCPDPVILLTEPQWMKIMSRRLCRQKYILIYQIQPDVNVRKAAHAYAKANNCKVIDNKRSLEFIIHNAPDAFLSWIYYAECVFTNSFHATAFSLIFNKPLGAEVELVGGGRNHRVLDMLARCGAVQCILTEQWVPFKGSYGNDLSRFREVGMRFLREICENSDYKE